MKALNLLWVLFYFFLERSDKYLKKEKTYEISVIDKTYSKIISDETKFYTSDTALELVFKLKETEYTFESAEIVLLNINDKSLITRRVAKSDEGFVYTFEKDIIAHYGEWKAQLMFIENVDAHVASPIKFRIENDLYNTKPQALSDVVSWVNLKLYAEKLVGEFKQAVDEAFTKNVEIENTFKTNEQNRQTAFENAEQERVSSELLRVENENQRKTDHANRSAELASKADKKQEEWITATLINGATGTVQYRKNEFGMVQIQGSVSIPNSALQPFLLPIGYRPRVTFSNAVTTRNNNNVYRFTMGTSGSSFLNTANIVVDLTGVNFEAGG